MVPCASLVRGLVVTIGQNTNMLSLVRHRLQRDGPVRVRSNDLQSTVRPSITKGKGLVLYSQEGVRVFGQAERYMMRAMVSAPVVNHERSPLPVTTGARDAVGLVNLQVLAVRLGLKVDLHTRVKTMLWRLVSMSLLYDDVGEVLSPCLLAAVREPCVLSLSFARYFAMVGVTHCYVVGTVRLMPLSESTMRRLSGLDQLGLASMLSLEEHEVLGEVLLASVRVPSLVLLTLARNHAMRCSTDDVIKVTCSIVLVT